MTSLSGYSGTATGPSHILVGGANEDATVVRRAVGGWVCGVVSDGCGSVSRAAEGSAATSSMIADALCRIADRIQTRGVGDWVVDDVIVELARVRKDLRVRFGDDLSEYAATIVGCLISPTGGFVLHIGDGITTSYALGEGTSSTVQLRKVHESPPENGDLSNETFYLTDRNWLHHVRISSFGSADLCVLCTDGAQAILYHANDLHADQLGSLLSAVDLQEPGHHSSHLSDLLDSREAQQLSSDDKSVVLLVSERARRELMSGRQLQLAEEMPVRAQLERPPEPKRVAPQVRSVTSLIPEPAIRLRATPLLGLALAFAGGLLLAFAISAGLGLLLAQPSTREPDTIQPANSAEPQISQPPIPAEPNTSQSVVPEVPASSQPVKSEEPDTSLPAIAEEPESPAASPDVDLPPYLVTR